MGNIPGTNVPAVTFGDRGFIAPSGPAVLAGVQADISAAFGKTLNFNLNTPQGQLASSIAALVTNFNSIFVYYTNQTNPNYATGRMQDGIAGIYFLDRDPAEPTVLQVQCTGAVGVPIPANSTITDEDNNIYQSTVDAEISSSGNVTIPFANQITGPTSIPGTVSIYQAIPGWDSVAVLSGVSGTNAESRSSFEQRRKETVAGNSFGAIGSIIGAVAKVSGVLDYFGYDNGTASPVTVQGVSIAENSIYICVEGGTDLDVAQAILSKKAPGCGYTGNTTVTAYDSNPLYASPIAYDVTFQRPTSLPILFAVAIVNGPLVPSDAAVQVQNAIVAASSGADGGQRARIAQSLLATRYVAPVAALGPWALISSLLVGSNNTPGAVFVGSISGLTLTVGSLTSGTIAIGQFLTDVAGDIAPGTKIVSGSGSTWTLNQTNTLSSTTIKGSVAASSQVTINANQFPEVDAANVSVTFV